MAFPLGPPEIIWKDFDPIENYWGIVKCRVVCPRGLYLPILPYRAKNGKLMFPACSRCCDEYAIDPKCIHDNLERSWIRIFSTMELMEALKRGYRVLHICVIWHWEKWSNALFRDYLLNWISLKLKASGILDGMNNEEANNYVKAFNERYGFELTAGDFNANASLKTLAKMALVSFWGRWCMNTDCYTTKLFDNYSDIQSLFHDPNIMVGDIFPVNNKLLMVTYKHKKSYQPVVANLSIVIGILTTSYARLQLLSHIEKAFELHGMDSVLYFDTDSLIVCQKHDAPILPTGQFVGDLKMELDSEFGPGAVGVKFFCSAAKSYGILVRKTDGTTQWSLRLKGFKSCTRLSESLTPEIMLEHLLKDPRNRELEIDEPPPDPVEILYPNQLLKNKWKAAITTEPMKKKFSVIYDKRIVIENFKTLPYGYS